MRISRPQMFMKIAHVLAERSTCHRLNVGAILVYRDNIISCGYNGPPSGEPHCQGNDCPLDNGRCTRAIHAEANAITRAGELPNGTLELYCTHSPCSVCAVKIAEVRNICRVYYEIPFRDTLPLQYLMKCDVTVYRVNPSGYLISEADGVVTEV